MGYCRYIVEVSIVRVTASAQKDPSSQWPHSVSLHLGPALNSVFQFPVSSFPASLHFQLRFQPCEDDAQQSRCAGGGGTRQEAGERRGQQFLPTRAFEHVCLESKGAPPLPRLTGRSSAGKKVRQGQGGSRASSCQSNQSSLGLGGRPTPRSACLPLHPLRGVTAAAASTKIWALCVFSFSNVNRRIGEIRARSISILGNT